MTPQQAIDNIAVYSALHNGVLDSSVKVLDKSVKALEIIKNKKVDTNWFKFCDSSKDYNKSVPRYKHITQEEFEILKEEFSNDKR